MQICAAASSTNDSALVSRWSALTQFRHVSYVKRNAAAAPPHQEEEELNKIHKCQGILLYVRLFLNACVHVRSVGLYEYLRHSMTSHSGCWWLTSCPPPLPANWGRGGVVRGGGAASWPPHRLDSFHFQGLGYLHVQVTTTTRCVVTFGPVFV